MTRVGIIGTGWGARVQVPIFREAGFEVVAIAGHSHEKTRKIASELGVRPVGKWRNLVSEDLDLVSIVTPPAEHLEMARAAIAAGKHVICEKPTALNADEAEQLAAAARSSPELITLIDHELRFLPAWREARQRIAGDFGVRYIEVRYASPGRGERLREWNWWSDAAQGGGIWGAVGSHFVDAIRYLAGDIDGVQGLMSTIIRERPAPEAHSAEDSSGRHLRKAPSDDFAVVNLRLKSGALATIALSAVASGPDEAATITIHGEAGALRLTGEQLFACERGRPFALVLGDKLSDRPGNSPGGAFGTGTHHLAVALKSAIDDRDRSPLDPAATFEDGLAQQRVLDAARKSSAAGGSWENV